MGCINVALLVAVVASSRLGFRFTFDILSIGYSVPIPIPRFRRLCLCLFDLEPLGPLDDVYPDDNRRPFASE